MRVCPRCAAVYITNVQWCGIDGETLVEQDQDPLVGTAIERYQIEERLGMGGMGCVYRARHAVIEREYAIKVLYGDFAGDDKFRARFKREAQSISKIRHPNIVQVEDFGTTQAGLTFLAMELVRGRTLEEVIAAEAPMSPLRTAAIVRQVVAGLDAAHQLGFVHRDVKPSNIMLTKNETYEGEFVKILDFGAVSLRSIPMEERLTSIGHIIGTPTYMAPEQTQDPGVAPTADFYSVGCMMHEMLSGTPPFVGNGRAEVMVKHITEEPPPAPPSRGLELLIKKLLKKYPAERPQSGVELIAAIEKLNIGLKPLPDSVAPRRPSNVGGDLSKGADVDHDAFHSAPTNHMMMDEASQRELRSIAQDAANELPTPPNDRSPHDTFPSLTGVGPEDGQWGPGWNVMASSEPPGYDEMAVAPGAPSYGAPQIAYGDGSAARALEVEHDETAEVEPVADTDQSPVPSKEAVRTWVVRKRDPLPQTDDLRIETSELPVDLDTNPSDVVPSHDVLYEPSRPSDVPPSPDDDAGPTQVDFQYEPAAMGMERPEVIAASTEDLQALEDFAASAEAQSDGLEVTEPPGSADADTPEELVIPTEPTDPSEPTAPPAARTQEIQVQVPDPATASDVAATILTPDQIELNTPPSAVVGETLQPSNRLPLERDPSDREGVSPTVDGAPAVAKPTIPAAPQPATRKRSIALPLILVFLLIAAALVVSVLLFRATDDAAPVVQVIRSD